MGIAYQRGTVGGLSTQVIADAGSASKVADSRSFSGKVVMCGFACVSWFVRTQKCVKLSTTAAGYEALADVLKNSCVLGRFAV